ncbi:hypothetical protein D3C73_1310200 [compost metagenome]
MLGPGTVTPLHTGDFPAVFAGETGGKVKAVESPEFLGVGRFAGGDLEGFRAGVNPHSGVDGQCFEPLNQSPEPTHRVLHAVAQVQGTHQVVHRRSSGRAGAQENRGIAKHLPEHRMLEPLGNVLVQGCQE